MGEVISFVEKYLDRTGSVWCRKEALYSYAAKHRKSLKRLPYLVQKGLLLEHMTGDGEVFITLPEFAITEDFVAMHVNRILHQYKRPSFSEDKIDEILGKAKEITGITLAPQQREAVIKAVNSGFCVITGGPGTGKTCTLTTLCFVLQELFFGIDIRFTAPTGKAARRIRESTKRPSKTAQKELAITPENKKKKIFTGDVLIVDEVSMLDLDTAKMVFESIHNGQKIILVGDINQLPSVGRGAVLRDLLWSEAVPFVQLTQTYRQAEDSNLFGNITAIKNGDWRLHEGDDFQVLKVNPDPIKQLLDMMQHEVDRFGVDNVACLLPYRKKGILCSNNLNPLIQNMLNPLSSDKPFLPVTKVEDGVSRRVSFNMGDPVMQLENQKECANGDVGKIIAFENGRMIVRYIDGCVSYTKKMVAEKLDLAYSMSINKSQGSEYDSVVMAITMDHKAMLKRNLVYTGVTRAKKRCCVLQDDNAMKIAISTEDEYQRITFLAEKIRLLRLDKIA